MPGVVYLDNLFWGLARTGRNSKAGVILHEVGHLAGLADWNNAPLGPFNDALWLAQDWPLYAIWAADNHQFYYENQ